MQNFYKDLEIGELVEQKVIDLLKKDYPTIKALKEYNSGFDLVDDNGYTVEVKFDRLSEKTPNTAFEYLYKSSPSGISTSKALDWAQILYFNNNWIISIINTDQLRMFLKNNWEHLEKINGGDNNDSRLILINKTDFLDNFPFSILL